MAPAAGTQKCPLGSPTQVFAQLMAGMGFTFTSAETSEPGNMYFRVFIDNVWVCHALVGIGPDAGFSAGTCVGPNYKLGWDYTSREAEKSPFLVGERHITVASIVRYFKRLLELHRSGALNGLIVHESEAMRPRADQREEPINGAPG